MAQRVLCVSGQSAWWGLTVKLRICVFALGLPTERFSTFSSLSGMTLRTQRMQGRARGSDLGIPRPEASTAAKKGALTSVAD